MEVEEKQQPMEIDMEIEKSEKSEKSENPEDPVWKEYQNAMSIKDDLLLRNVAQKCRIPSVIESMVFESAMDNT